MIEKIIKNGFIIKKNNLFNINNNHRLEALNIIADLSIKSHSNKENDFEHIKVIKDTNNFKYLNIVLKKVNKYFFKYLGKKLIYEDIWVQKTDIYSSHYNLNQPPFIPHIDKKRKFKIMIYLNEVDKYMGPIHFTNCDVNKYEKLRIDLKENYKKNKDNVITDIKLTEYVPCTGPVGTSVFFDTNCPHFAGKILKRNDFRLNYRINFIYKY